MPYTGKGHDRAMTEIPVMQRRTAQGPEMPAGVPASERTDGNRRIWRAETCCADFGDILAQSFGHQRKTDDIAHLALIGRHPEGGIAFQMFDRNKPFLMRKADIACRHVVLKINEAFGLP